MTVGHINVAQDRLADFCRRTGVRKLSVFGSALTDRFSDTSDVDVLVEFEPGQRVGYLRMAAMERELSSIFGNRKVDLRTPKELSKLLPRRGSKNSRDPVCSRMIASG